MSNEENGVPFENITNTHPEAEQLFSEVIERKKQYYLEQSRQLCPEVSPESAETTRLHALIQKTKQIIQMLSCFNRSWNNGMPEIQRACVTFFVSDNISRKERFRCAEKWSQWMEFFLTASRHRNLITGLLYSYYCQLRDLQRLVGKEPTPIPETLLE